MLMGMPQVMKHLSYRILGVSTLALITVQKGMCSDMQLKM